MNYYNENDPRTAEWIRQLIRAGEIPPGFVDTRPIQEVRPHEITQYVQHHFFAGIAGWSVALELAGWPIDRPAWTGSCPCQPFSHAGLKLGTADERHLWPVFFRLITQCRPQSVFGEQVASAIGKGWLDGISADLESEGYACGAAVLGAHSVGSPHIRQRLYWVANAGHESTGRCATPRQTQSRRALGDATGCGVVGGLADNNRNGRNPTPGREFHDEKYNPESRGSPSGLGNADSSGLSEQRGAVSVSPEQPAPELRGNAWGSFELLPCTDGKTRRIESGSFPLAHGVPGRVVPSGDPSVSYAQATAEGRVARLRGYGNSIVPQLAAQFILAALECAAIE